ncbi:MAG TPA: glycosyltransferase family 2 protein, partial [Candidatus Hydrogenedentes bacterium]|nr:glycosyltransferase family 2 protein [Candidatus Hydrogenedentota bacterium]
MKTISIVTGCFNEEENIRELVDRIRNVMKESPEYAYEHILIDNASKDNTVSILREIASEDKHIKVIVNTRNFGHVRSPYYALLQAKGDAVIGMASDLQDPPEMIPQFIKKWEEGFKIVLGVKETSSESPLFFYIRKAYYRMVSKLSEVELLKNTTGFGLYDQKVIEILRNINDPYPYFRGLICDIGFEIASIPFHQPTRKRGFTKNNFYT